MKSMHDHIENLSPPSTALRDLKAVVDSSGFWAMFYAAWHFRVDEKKFDKFAKCYCEDKSIQDAEEVLGNLLLQGLRTIELMPRWTACCEKAT
jgi:hypothetical protein